MIPAGQLVTQFRKFQLIQIGLLSRVVYNSFKGASPLERTIARKQLSYLLGVHAVVGGALGLPAANIMGWALASMFGDKDEPENAELLARRYILNNGGNKEVADLLLRGLPAWAGLDASTRLGMGLTFSALPFTEVTASRDGAFVVAGSLLGPWMGAVARAVDGYGQIGQGNILPGIAQMLPSLPMNLLKAYDMHTRGINDRRGDTLMQPEEIGYLELVTQGMGWPNKTLSDRHLIRGFEIEVKQHFRDRATRLRRIYADAYDANDQARMDRAIEEWLRLQQMKMNYRMGTWQSVGDLTKAPFDRMKREEGAIGGIATERTTVGFIEDMFM
jgi:hypothetical protein